MTAPSLRILLSSHVPKDPFGGSSRVLHMLDEGLRKLGHDVTTIHREDFPLTQRMGRLANRVFLPQAMSLDLRRFKPDGFDVVLAPSGVLYPWFKKVRERPVRPLLVEIIHGSAFFDHFATLEEAARGHLKLSAVYRHVTGSLPTKWDLEGSRAADLVVVNIGRDRDYMIDQGIPETKCRLIPLGLHPDMTAHALSDRAVRRVPRSVLWFGTWTDRKGISYLPRAWQAVRSRFPDATLTLGGTGTSSGVVAGEFAMEDRASLRILGRISIEEQLAEFDRHEIFLFPSLSEGFGFALLEAMACGLAPVATFTGLGADHLQDRENAMIIQPASSLHMANALITLLEDDGLRSRISANAARDANRLTAERMINSYEQAFFEHIDRRAAGSPAG